MALLEEMVASQKVMGHQGSRKGARGHTQEVAGRTPGLDKEGAIEENHLVVRGHLQ
jgi:hypothetical protein